LKLTKTTLKQIIKEELSKALNEVTEMQPVVQMDDEMNAALSRGEVNEDELMMAAKYNLPWKSQENRQTLNFLKSFEQDLDQYASAGKHGTARQAINKARQDGLIDKNTWRKLRRKHHKRRKPNVKRALDRMEKDPVPTLTPPKKGQKAPAIYKNKAAVKRAVKRGAMAPDEARLAREWEAADTPAKQAALKKKYGIK
jgi:hypothetical protein